MTENANTLRTLIALFNSGEPIDVTQYFTPDFELDAPADGARRTGYEGALGRVSVPPRAALAGFLSPCDD